MYFGFASAAAVTPGSEDDPGCIFFTLKTYQRTFISEILSYCCSSFRTHGRNAEHGGRTDRHGSRNRYLDCNCISGSTDGPYRAHH